MNVLQILLFRYQIRLRPSRRAVMTVSHSGRVELCLGSLTYKDAGVYTCVATNEVGRAETSARLIINERSLGSAQNHFGETIEKVVPKDVP